MSPPPDVTTLRAPRRRYTVLLPILCALCLCAPPDVSALERLQRRFGPEQGLPFSEIFSIAQDPRGFLWIATAGGLLRYDGLEMRPWPGQASRSIMITVAAGPAGEILATDYFSRLFEIVGEQLLPIVGPDGRQAEAHWRPAWDDAGALWIVSDGRIHRRLADGAWSEISTSSIGPQQAVGVVRASAGSMLVITRKGIWRLGKDLSCSHVADLERIQALLERGSGTIAALTGDGRVLEISEGSVTELYQDAARAISMVERSGTLWASYDSGLVRLSPGDPPERMGPDEEVPGGGSLLVDREGSLWLGTYRGLRQMPAPETVAWGRADGLLADGIRRLAETSEGIWADSWAGLSLMRRGGSAFHPERFSGTGTSALCVASNGTLWTASSGRIMERRAGSFIDHTRPEYRSLRDCAAGAQGRVWMGGKTGVILAAPGDATGRAALHDIPWPPGLDAEAISLALLEDSTARLWVAAGDQVCSTRAGSAAGTNAAWACRPLPGSGGVFDLAELASGAIWAATAEDGVYRWMPSNGSWEQIPGSRQLPSLSVRRVRPAAAGGAWIISFGTIVRVAERPETSAGWEVVERPSAWQGLMISDAEDILEESSGNLWVATLAGLVHMPPEVRTVPGAPQVELVDVTQDGTPLSWSGLLRLPWTRNRIELRVAALSYRDPALLRYQIRLNPNAAWVDAAGPPSFRFVNLAPGAHQLEVRASLDETHWSPDTAGLSFTVLPPFWKTWWFFGLAAAALAAAAVLVHRQRVARLLALERVRTRIATDLHDEVGAGLSEIALMGELWARQESAPTDGGSLPSRISAASRRLVDSMSDIVWAIDPDKDHVFSLSQRMRRFVTSFLRSAGLALRFESIDESHDRALDGDARRELLLAFQEMIHNCVKHAHCTTVEVRLHIEGGSLHLQVADDGAGFEPERIDEGTGMSSLRRRAARLGGFCAVTSQPGSGAKVTIRIPLEGRGRPSPIREGRGAHTGDKMPP